MSALRASIPLLKRLPRPDGRGYYMPALRAFKNRKIASLPLGLTSHRLSPAARTANHRSSDPGAYAPGFMLARAPRAEITAAIGLGWGANASPIDITSTFSLKASSPD